MPAVSDGPVEEEDRYEGRKEDVLIFKCMKGLPHDSLLRFQR